MAVSSVPLLTVKYAVPPARAGTVARQRLADRLEGSGDATLCVVVAPPGWGKTTMLSQWTAEPDVRGRAAWVSLDPSDDEPVRFWSYLLTALCVVAPEVGSRALATLVAPGIEPVTVTLPILINDAVASDGRYVLILDDVHVLRDRRILEGLEFLITYLPSTLRLVLAGRADPALPLGRWRARRLLTEIRAPDLAFTPQESEALLAAVGITDLDSSASALLCQRTEGWAVGLHLAAQAVRSSPHPEETVARLRGDDRHLLDYFESEILDQLDPSHREFLVRTSVLDRLSGSLCDAVLERTGSARVLAELEEASHFVSALDPGRRWYRCHGLFRESLRRELQDENSDASTGLLTRAATWYLEEDQVDEAVRHLILAGDHAAAMAMLSASQAWFFERGAAADFLLLGEESASAANVADAEVFLMMAYAAVMQGRFDRVRHWCDRAAPLLDGDAVSIDGWSSAAACLLTMMAAYGHGNESDGADLVDGVRAVELEADPGLPGYVLARTALASVHTRAENYADAVGLLSDAWRQPSRSFLPTPALLQVAGLYALNLLQVGDLEAASTVCAEVRPAADAVEGQWGDASAASVTWLRLVEGELAHRSRDLTVARSLLTRTAELAESWGRHHEVVLALTTLASTELAMGDLDAARDAVTRAREAADTGPVRAPAIRELQRVESAMGRGALRAARRVGRLYEDLTDRELSLLRELSGPHTQREIGDALFLSINTVKGYSKSLYRKLGASSRQEAVDTGRNLGLI
jgi:LuxR family transcriptional regulator, maltose regulon positive regulatory protein